MARRLLRPRTPDVAPVASEPPADAAPEVIVIDVEPDADAQPIDAPEVAADAPIDIEPQPDPIRGRIVSVQFRFAYADGTDTHAHAWCTVHRNGASENHEIDVSSDDADDMADGLMDYVTEILRKRGAL